MAQQPSINDKDKIVLIAFIGLSALLVVGIFILETFILSVAMLAYELLLLVGIAYIAFRLCVVVKAPGFQQVLVLLGTAVFMYAVVRDILSYNHIYIFPYSEYSNDSFSVVALLLLAFMLLGALLFNTFNEIHESREKEQRLAYENVSLKYVNQLCTDAMNTISHETKTPLGVLSGYAEIVAMDLRAKGGDERYIADLNMIASEAQNVANLMQGLQDIAQVESGDIELSSVDFSETVHQSARLFEHVLSRKDTRLVLEMPVSPILVYGNALGLSQVLFNLLSNAGKHTENGEVRISAQVLEDTVVVLVSDTGTGIPSEFLPLAFEWHSHEDPEGTGLGLNLCRRIVTEHGGSISLESNPGEGTTVTFSLPLYKQGES